MSTQNILNNLDNNLRTQSWFRNAGISLHDSDEDRKARGKIPCRSNFLFLAKNLTLSSSCWTRKIIVGHGYCLGSVIAIFFAAWNFYGLEPSFCLLYSGKTEEKGLRLWISNKQKWRSLTWKAKNMLVHIVSEAYLHTVYVEEGKPEKP